MTHLTFEREHIIASEVFQRERHLEAPVGADRNRFQPFYVLEGFQYCRACVVLIGQHIAFNDHSRKAVLGMGMLRQRLHIGGKALNEAFVLFDFLREVLQEIVFQTVLLALVICLHQLQSGNIHVQIHLFFDARITCAQGFDLSVGKSLLVDVVAGANRRFTGHNLRDEFLFVFHGLPQICVERGFRNVAENVDFGIHVALADDSA